MLTAFRVPQRNLADWVLIVVVAIVAFLGLALFVLSTND
jgi:hypothetical protein